MVEIPRLDPSTAYRTLGAWIAADRNQRRQLEVLREHAAVWTEAINRSSLSSRDKKIAYTGFLRPQLLYPLVCTTIAEIDLKHLFRPVLDVILHTI